MPQQNKLKDLWIGLAAASVVLPQAVAFGASLWALFSDQVASGALAGMLAVVVFSSAASIAAGTRGLIAAPTGPTMVLLSGFVLSAHALRLPAETILHGLTWVLMIAGGTQILISFSKGGRLIKFIPYPVVAGFMTGSALQMVASQLPAATGVIKPELFSHYYVLPVITAISTYSAIVIVPKWLRWLPGTVAGLLVGTLVFYVLNTFLQQPLPVSWRVGELPALSMLHVQLPMVQADLPWGLIIGSGLALAVMASLDTLLTSVVADTVTHTRHHARRELIGQGSAHLLSALVGGISGAGTTGATLVAIRSGGGRWVGLFTAVSLLLIAWLFAPLAAYLPLSVLAGIILYVAVSMIERSIPVWLRHRRTRMDAGIALAVTVVTVFYDLMVAVGVGVLIAIIKFVREQIQASVIHERSTAVERPSLRRRTTDERQLLQQHGQRVVLYRLQGNLFFGTVDNLFDRFATDLTQPVWLILDLSRVKQIDLTAARMLQQLADDVQQRGGELIFASVHKVTGIDDEEMEKSLQWIAPYARHAHVATFVDVDEAQEYAENALLGQLGAAPAFASDEVKPDQTELFRELTPQQCQRVLDNASYIQLNDGQYLFHAGEQGDSLYVVLRGVVDALLPYGQHHYRRVASFGPGTFFGEVAFLQPGSRTTHARASSEVKLLEIDRQQLAQLQQTDPQIAVQILQTLGKNLSEHLRWADHELRRLSD